MLFFFVALFYLGESDFEYTSLLRTPFQLEISKAVDVQNLMHALEEQDYRVLANYHKDKKRKQMTPRKKPT